MKKILERFPHDAKHCCVIVHDKHPLCVCHLEGLLKIAAQFKLLLRLLC